MYRPDWHIHTYYSTDSKEDPEKAVIKAIETGLSSICFTDHMDLDFPEDIKKAVIEEIGEESVSLHKKVNGLSEDAELPVFSFDIDRYMSELNGLKKKYSGKIDILLGIEFGMQPGNSKIFDEYRYMKRHYGFDHMLGSLHLVSGRDPFFKESWGNGDGDLFIDTYFNELAECVEEFGDFTSLAHIDYAARYLPELSGMSTEEINAFSDSLYEKHKEPIDKVLKTIIKRKQALEINVAPLRRTYAHPHPSKGILSRYFELGGERITFGSDAHRAENVGCIPSDMYERYRKYVLKL